MNLRPAPFCLNERTVKALLEGSETHESLMGVAVVPVLRLQLVNMPRRSEDPRLARGNDNGGAVADDSSSECGKPGEQP